MNEVNNLLTVIHLWSTPRSMSTSLMYSFAQHPAIAGQVIDEPFYAYFLHQTGVTRPYTDMVMKSQSIDPETIVNSIYRRPNSASQPVVRFVKHIAKQIGGLSGPIMRYLLTGDSESVSHSPTHSDGDRPNVKHVILVRDPALVLKSFHTVLGMNGATLAETSLMDLCWLYGEVKRLTGLLPVILDSFDLQQMPGAYLQRVCESIDLPWNPAMLHWPAGPKSYDGVWAPWWYEQTHKLSGFQSTFNAAAKGPYPSQLIPIVEQCWPFYQFLIDRKINLIMTMSMRLQDDITDTAPADQSAVSTHDYHSDERNSTVLVGIVECGVTGTHRLQLVPRRLAKVSVLDSAFMLGDGVWEGVRVNRGRLLFWPQHLDRLKQGCRSLDIQLPFSDQQLTDWLHQVLEANGMRNIGRASLNSSNGTAEVAKAAKGIHIRLMISRGEKPTPYQDPRITLSGPLIVILAEWKQAAAKVYQQGISLYTVHIRRASPDTQDPLWNSHSKLNCISACIQASKAGADEALMLDQRGFVATCNSTNFFIIHRPRPILASTITETDNGCSGGGDVEVWTSSGGACLNGITRQAVIELCRSKGLVVKERDFSLTHVYAAEEAFVTGTFAGVIPVKSVDGRLIGCGDGRVGPIVQQLRQWYADLVESLSL